MIFLKCKIHFHFDYLHTSLTSLKDYECIQYTERDLSDNTKRAFLFNKSFHDLNSPPKMLPFVETAKPSGGFQVFVFAKVVGLPLPPKLSPPSLPSTISTQPFPQICEESVILCGVTKCQCWLQMLLSGTLRRVPVWQHVNLIVCYTVWERSDLARFEHISLSRAT